MLNYLWLLGYGNILKFLQLHWAVMYLCIYVYFVMCILCFKFISDFCADGAHYTSAWKRCSHLTSYYTDNCKAFVEHGGVELMEQAVSSGSLNQDVLSSITWTVSTLVRHKETRLQVTSSEVLVECCTNNLRQSTNKPDQVKIVFLFFTPLIPGNVSIRKYIILNDQ